MIGVVHPAWKLACWIAMGVGGWLVLASVVLVAVTFPSHFAVGGVAFAVGVWVTRWMSEGRRLDAEAAWERKDIAVDTAMGLAFEAERVEEQAGRPRLYDQDADLWGDPTFGTWGVGAAGVDPRSQP